MSIFTHSPHIVFTEDIPLSTLTSLRVGGNARFVVSVKSTDYLREVLVHLKAENIPYVVLGGGSNTIFPTKEQRPILNRRLAMFLRNSF